MFFGFSFANELLLFNIHEFTMHQYLIYDNNVNIQTMTSGQRKFNKEDLEKLISIAAYALEQEDRYITGCTTVRQDLYNDGKPPGILRFNNERFYQYIIARALMSNYKYKIDVEKETHDIVLLNGELATPREYVAVGEIKRWMSSSGGTEIQHIIRDLHKISEVSSFLIIVTAWSRVEAEENMEYLRGVLNLNKDNIAGPKSFPTIGWPKAPERDFAVIGYLVNNS